MNCKTSLLALALGTIILGAGPVFTPMTLLGASPAEAKSKIDWLFSSSKTSTDGGWGSKGSHGGGGGDDDGDDDSDDNDDSDDDHGGDDHDNDHDSGGDHDGGGDDGGSDD